MHDAQLPRQIASLLSREAEQRLAGVRFPIRVLVDGRLAGVHSGPQSGSSVEFAEHKEYAPGDDLRHLNWKAYARTDKFYIRQFTRESHAEIVIILDESASMNIKSEYSSDSKLSYAAKLATALSYVLLHQNDAVGFLSVRGHSIGHSIPVRGHPSHLRVIQDVLMGIVNSSDGRTAGHEGVSSLAEALDVVVSRRQKRGAVLIISDLFMAEDELLPLLSHIRNAGNACWVIQVLDPTEWDMSSPERPRTFPFDGSIVFRSPETGHGLLLDARPTRIPYIQRFGQWLARLEEQCAERRVSFIQVNTDEDIVEFILRYVLGR